MTPELLRYALGLFIALFAIGTLLCIKLYKWDYARFFSSTLWTKVLYWIPIFIIFLVVLYVQFLAATLVTLVLVGFAVREILRLPQRHWIAWLYMLTISIALAHLMLFFLAFDSQRYTAVLLAIGFSSVLSDVFAYFFGNFFGRHRLPRWINQKKSWEGIAGQLIGALIGFLLVIPVLNPAPPLALAIIIGVASAVGDVINSIVKRKIGIKDWGETIPGHGGVLDRFASLALAIAAAFWFTIVI